MKGRRRRKKNTIKTEKRIIKTRINCDSSLASRASQRSGGAGGGRILCWDNDFSCPPVFSSAPLILTAAKLAEGLRLLRLPGYFLGMPGISPPAPLGPHIRGPTAKDRDLHPSAEKRPSSSLFGLRSRSASSDVPAM